MISKSISPRTLSCSVESSICFPFLLTFLIRILFYFSNHTNFFSSCSKKTLFFQELPVCHFQLRYNSFWYISSVSDHQARQDLSLLVQAILHLFPQKMTSMKPLMGSFFIANLYPYITLIWWIVLWTYVLPLSFTCVFLDHLSSLGKKDLKFAWFIFNLIMYSFIDSPKWDCDAFQRNNMCLFHH